MATDYYLQTTRPKGESLTRNTRIGLRSTPSHAISQLVRNGQFRRRRDRGPL